MTAIASSMSAPTPRARGKVRKIPPDLTREELSKRLRLGSTALVKELYEIALRQIQSETGRQTRLDGKATSLLTAVGLSLTVAFTFGGQVLLAHATELRAIDAPRWTFALVIFAFALIAGLGAGVLAMLALRVQAYATVDEQAVFNETMLAQAEGAETEEEGVAEYRRYLTVQLWRITQRQLHAHESKAGLIEKGQFCFLTFLGTLFLICLYLVASIVG
jgi:hypothetical protein